MIILQNIEQIEGPKNIFKTVPIYKKVDETNTDLIQTLEQEGWVKVESI